MAINLVVLDGKHRGQTIILPRTQFVIGRDPTCHLRPVSTDVSKFHCAIAHMGDRIAVRDLKSTNGTFLNGQRVTGTARARNGDVLEIGPLKFKFMVVGEVRNRPGDSYLEWLMRSPNELESRVLDPGQETAIIEVLPGTPSNVPPSAPRAYSEEATIVAGQFLREYMQSKKRPGKS